MNEYLYLPLLQCKSLFGPVGDDYSAELQAR